MKIVHICLAGPFTDGWNYQDNMISKYHKKMGFDVTVIASQWIRNEGEIVKTSKTDYINIDGVKVKRLANKIGTVDSKFKLYNGLYDTLCNEQPDIIFVHNFQYFDIINVLKYVRKHSAVLFIDNHSDFSNSATNFVSKWILHKFLWKCLVKKIEPYTKRFYGVLPARADFLKTVYGLPEDKCELLVMGADDDCVIKSASTEVRDTIRKKYNLAEDDFVVVTGGKIDAFKTQTLLLMEAVHKIDNPRVKLLVFGSVTPELKDKVAELDDGEKVQYIGWIDAVESYKYFAMADLAVFPGRHSVFWEQVVGQGIPMICKKWAGTTHVDLGGNVHFLNEDSVEEIKREIKNLLENPEMYKRMKAVAEEQGRKVFSYNEIAKRSIEV